MRAGAARGSWWVLSRGLQLSPELRDGLTGTLLLALVATAGRVVVPVAIQLTIDRGVAQADPGMVAGLAAAAFTVVGVTAAAGYLMISRLVSTSERALSNLRVRAFRHIHDLSLLHQADEHRGALVARVTADVDEISRFMQWGGLILVVNLGQLLFATVVMAVYSWQLTLVVLVTFAPFVAVLRWFQGRLAPAYDVVRTRVGQLLSSISESVVGAAVIRAYGVEERTDERVGQAVERQFVAAYRAHRLASFMFSSGETFSALATAAAVVVGVLLGLGGQLSAGQLVAFLFLITLFVGPVQVATEVLDQAQTAIAGWRRVLEVLDTPADVADPAGSATATSLPAGPLRIRFEHVDYAYPIAAVDEDDGIPALRARGPLVLHDVDLEVSARSRVAVVGQTGSGKTTFAKLLTRLMDPTAGRITLNGVPLPHVPFRDLRRRVVMVPQDGFLFDTTIEENIRMGRRGASTREVRRAVSDLGLVGWVDGLPAGLATAVGERGTALSAGERQLVALARAYVADPDLLVLDEATSALDPATEARVQRALEGLTRGRTTITIAHRLTTAEAADEILVFDEGRVAQRGTHAQLRQEPGGYALMHTNWTGSR